MSGLNFVFKIIRNLLVTVILVTVSLALLGYFLAGRAGFVNGASWGVLLGSVGGIYSSAVLVLANSGRDYSGRFGAWWIKQETEGDGKPPSEEPAHSQWPVKH